MPYEAVARIVKAGLFTVRIPTRFGGAGGSVKDAIALLIPIASVDSNVAQALRPHFDLVGGC
ncbi:acyl-CoA dehydrogenase family protein [Pseudomonas typographi]|uniref:acyl-CoA dehydrogenase family protein n=1 Tax=Pseudomonas typographi TaxID=2715964 RepID=UPI001EEDEB8C|nr:acyl-CoA dehydrogenase family protein [Pseudomonas typographi]